MSKMHAYAVTVIMALTLAGAVLLSRAYQRRTEEATILESAETAPPEEAEPETPRESRPKVVLKSQLAGQWYDADPERLSAELQGYLDKAEVAPLEKVCALILPHAGYRYSGQIAAYGVKQVAGHSYRRVIILGPSHRTPMENMASVPKATHYATPLGEVPLDTAFIDALLRHPMFHTVAQAHQGEHSVQIEIPLLQKALGDFLLVPIVVGQLDLAASRSMAEILLSLVDEETLVTVSSDFTHYGSNYGYAPFKEDIPENLEKLDMGAYAQIRDRDAQGFYNYIQETGATICGRCPITVLLSMLPGDAEAHSLRYDTSGALTKDFSNSVSYLSVGFTGAWEKGPGIEPKDETALTQGDKKRLLDLARETIQYALDHQAIPSETDLDFQPTPSTKAVRGAFVTLEKNGNLRGCIGDIFPSRPLYKAVISNAINAAFRDTRFRPVAPAELAELDIEISVLTPPQAAASYEDIEIGRHGMVLRKNGRRAVFLPQVAPEQGWDLATTLSHLSQKAGLPADAWKSGAKFEVFEAIAFGEEEG